MSEASKNLVKVLRDSGLVTDPVLSQTINNAVSKPWTSLTSEELRGVHKVLDKVAKILDPDPVLSKAINNVVSKPWAELTPKELQEAYEVLDRVVKILVPAPASYKPANKTALKSKKPLTSEASPSAAAIARGRHFDDRVTGKAKALVAEGGKVAKTTATRTTKAISPETPAEVAWRKAIQKRNKADKIATSEAVKKGSSKTEALTENQILIIETLRLKSSKTPIAPKLRFERRHTSVPIHRRELVHFQTKNVPELQDRLDRMEIGLITTIGEKDPVLYEFLEWFSEECRLFGLRIRPGLAALYWSWADKEIEAEIIAQKCKHPEDENSCIRFSRERYYQNATELGRSIRYGSYDNILYTGVFLLTQFIWWSAGEILYRDYLTSSVCEFIEFKDHGKMPDWLKRRRRRLASSQRRAVKEALSNMVSALDDNEE